MIKDSSSLSLSMSALVSGRDKPVIDQAPYPVMLPATVLADGIWRGHHRDPWCALFFELTGLTYMHTNHASTSQGLDAYNDINAVTAPLLRAAHTTGMNVNEHISYRADSARILLHHG